MICRENHPCQGFLRAAAELCRDIYSRLFSAAELPDSRLSVSAAFAITSLPVLIDPVNTSLSMPGCVAIRSPTLAPPVTVLMTPGGQHGIHQFDQCNVDSGV